MLGRFLSGVLIVLGMAGNARCDDPLDYLPKSVRVAVVVDHPRTLAETVTHLEAFTQAQSLPQVRPLYDSPITRRLLKLLEFSEKTLGARWPELLDQIAGNGLVVSLELGTEAHPAVAISSGKDAEQVGKAFRLALKVLEEEITRQGGRDQLTIIEKDGVTTVHLAMDLHFAQVGSLILVSNKAEFLDEAIATGQSGKRDGAAIRKARAEMARLIPADPLAWLWLDFASLKTTQSAKDFYESTQKEFIQTAAAGATIDCLRRSDLVVAGLYQEATGFRLRVRLPAGREGMWSDLALHVPAKGTPGTLPLLEPKGTLYSQSFYLDLAYAWKNRDRMISGEVRMQLDEARKAAAKFLPTQVSLDELFAMWGPYHRIVVAEHDHLPYKAEPKRKLPAFAYVASMRDPELGTNVEAIIRAVGLLGTLQVGLKSQSVEHEGVKVAGYRFPEDKPVPTDPEGVRFNFEPCFAIVGDQLVVASTFELGKKIITELRKPQQPTSAVLWRGKVSAANSTIILGDEPDALITEAVLNRGVNLAEARRDTAQFLNWIRTLGTARLEITITENEYQLDVVWTPEKMPKQ